MLDKLEDVEKRYHDLEAMLVDPAVIANRKEFVRVSRERSAMEEVIARYRDWKKIVAEEKELAALLDDADPEMREMASGELPGVRVRKEELEQALRLLLVPRDPNDDKSVILEIRAGTGGEEASLFAADLFRMYTRYGESRGWRVEVLSSNATGLGGYKEIIASIEGAGAYSRLKYEGGVHRVQRVPATEASGRIHTSAVTVAVLPEADEVDVEIDDKDLRIDVFRSSGPGGQSVNTTDSAVRVTHLPSGIVVSCQDEKSQHKNKAKALKILRARLLERAEEEQRAAVDAHRKSMVGSGDRSERIRTYNFPQNRVTDHRINLTTHALDRVLEGDLEIVVTPLVTWHQAEALKAERA
ncbi:MAG: peptide chain release factor 1 [Thermodesulfobacteriota bacterium]